MSNEAEHNAMSDTEAMNESILQRRADILAQQIEKLDTKEGTTALLEFSIMGLRYAVPLNKVHAVTQISEITAIPLVPRHIPGIIRRRGESIALVNLEYFFHSNRVGISDADYAIIVTGASKQLALQVENIIGVVLIPEKELVAPQDNFDPAQAPYVFAVTIDGLIIVDLDRLVSAKGFTAEKVST